MKHFILITIGFLLLLTYTPSAIAESSQNHGGNGTLPEGSNSVSGERQSQPSLLTDRELKFLSTHFFLSEVTVWNKFSQKLPLAIEKAMKSKEETESSQSIAELMGMINRSQAEKVITEAKKERDSEKAKKPNGGEDRYIGLMDRLIWGAKSYTQDPSKEESAEKYNEEFTKAFKIVGEKNQETLEKIKQASEGNEQAKEWLRKNLDVNSLLSFAEGQKKYGNGELADRLIDGLSFKEGKNKFLDMSLQNETQRLHLGTTSDSVTKAFDKLIETRTGFKGALVSFTPFQNTPMKQWFVNAQDEFKSGAPVSFPQVKISAATGVNQSSQTSASNTSPGAAQNAASTKISQTCNRCHSVSITDGVLWKDGGPTTKANILKALTTVPKMKTIDPSEKASLISLINKWIK